MSISRPRTYVLLSVLLLLPGLLFARGWELGYEVGHRAMHLSMAADRVWSIEPLGAAFVRDIERLELPMGGRDMLIVEGERQFSRSPEDFTWIGQGEQGELAVLTYRGKALAGKLYVDGRTFEIRPDAEYGTVMIELDTSRFPACSGAEDPAEHHHVSLQQHEFAETTESDLHVESDWAGDDAIRMDTLVAFTPAVADRLGDEDQRWAVALLAVDLTNLAFANSEVDARIRVNHVDVVASQESVDCVGDTGDLFAAANNSELQSLRDAHLADLVVMVTDSSDYCGCAYVQRNPGPGFASWAYQATAIGCAVGGLVVAHEFGHNLGMEHDPENSGAYPDDASYPWSFGHFVDGDFRTIMSYATECSDCPRTPHFSNPDVSLAGEPVGIEGERDNAETARATAPIVRDFRVASDEAMPIPSLSPSSLAFSLVSGQSGQYTVQLLNEGDDAFEWMIEQTVLETSGSGEFGHDPALDEYFYLPTFTVTGPDDSNFDYIVYSRAGGYTTIGEVVGISFQGQVELQGDGDKPADLAMIVRDPESNWNSFGRGRAWDFNDAEGDGFYQSTFTSPYDTEPRLDKGRWQFWFTSDSEDEQQQTWSDVQITLHKQAVDTGCDAVADVSWLTGVSPADGVLGSGQGEDITVSVDTVGLSAGNYSAALCLKVNDPRIETMGLEIELAVGDDSPIILQDRFETD